MTVIVSAREANQKFSDLLGRAARGESVVITRRGEPVARLGPYKVADGASDRAAAWDRLMAILGSGLQLGGEPFDRDSLYDR